MMHTGQFSDLTTEDMLKSSDACSHCGCTCNGRYDRLVCKGSIHQADVDSGGSQCVCTALLFLCTTDIPKYPSDVDTLLLQGTELYNVIGSDRNVMTIHEVPSSICIGNKSYNLTCHDPRSGLVSQISDDAEALIFSVKSAMFGSVEEASTMILTIGNARGASPGTSIALKRTANGFIAFDSHSRDDNGLCSPDGKAVVLKLPTISEVSKYVDELAGSISADINVPFEITAISITERCSLDLQQRIEELQSQLVRSHTHISSMEHEFQNRIQVSEYELFKLRDEFVKLRDRYERLMESHKRMQKINDSLENKLLKVVNTSETDKTDLQKEVASLTSRLIETKAIVGDLEEENERFRTDCNLAVQLLHCKPSNFVAQRLDGLPLSLQERVKAELTSEQLMNLENGNRETTKLIHVPMQTFPPTAMVFSVPKSEKDTSKDGVNGSCKTAQTVPMSLIANVLTPTDSTRKAQRTYICMKCRDDYVFAHKETQTSMGKEGGKEVTLRVHRKVRNQLSTSSTETDI